MVKTNYITAAFPKAERLPAVPALFFSGMRITTFSVAPGGSFGVDFVPEMGILHCDSLEDQRSAGSIGSTGSRTSPTFPTFVLISGFCEACKEEHDIVIGWDGKNYWICLGNEHFVFEGIAKNPQDGSAKWGLS